MRQDGRRVTIKELAVDRIADERPLSQERRHAARSGCMHPRACISGFSISWRPRPALREHRPRGRRPLHRSHREAGGGAPGGRVRGRASQGLCRGSGAPSRHRRARRLAGGPGDPRPCGFGSGTQLALSVAAALAALDGRPFSPDAFADALDRGNRSGVGLAAFTQGGLIVDGGRDASNGPPPLIARSPILKRGGWLLILDEGMTGVHGTREVEAFRDLPRFPEAQAAEICRIVLMQVLPSVATAEPEGFGASITTIQRLIGDHFAPHQGGRYASPAVAEALAAIAARGVAGYGQSSWGPTGFAPPGVGGRGPGAQGRPRTSVPCAS